MTYTEQRITIARAEFLRQCFELQDAYRRILEHGSCAYREVLVTVHCKGKWDKQEYINISLDVNGEGVLINSEPAVKFIPNLEDTSFIHVIRNYRVLGIGLIDVEDNLFKGECQ